MEALDQGFLFVNGLKLDYNRSLDGSKDIFFVFNFDLDELLHMIERFSDNMKFPRFFEDLFDKIEEIYLSFYIDTKRPRHEVVLKSGSKTLSINAENSLWGGVCKFKILLKDENHEESGRTLVMKKSRWKVMKYEASVSLYDLLSLRPDFVEEFTKYGISTGWVRY